MKNRQTRIVVGGCTLLHLFLLHSLILLHETATATTNATADGADDAKPANLSQSGGDSAPSDEDELIRLQSLFDESTRKITDVFWRQTPRDLVDESNRLPSNESSLSASESAIATAIQRIQLLVPSLFADDAYSRCGIFNSRLSPQGHTQSADASSAQSYAASEKADADSTLDWPQLVEKANEVSGMLMHALHDALDSHSLNANPRQTSVRTLRTICNDAKEGPAQTLQAIHSRINRTCAMDDRGRAQIAELSKQLSPFAFVALDDDPRKSLSPQVSRDCILLSVLKQSRYRQQALHNATECVAEIGTKLGLYAHLCSGVEHLALTKGAEKSTDDDDGEGMSETHRLSALFVEMMGSIGRWRQEYFERLRESPELVQHVTEVIESVEEPADSSNATAFTAAIAAAVNAELDALLPSPHIVLAFEHRHRETLLDSNYAAHYVWQGQRRSANSSTSASSIARRNSSDFGADAPASISFPLVHFSEERQVKVVAAECERGDAHAAAATVEHWLRTSENNIRWSMCFEMPVQADYAAMERWLRALNADETISGRLFQHFRTIVVHRQELSTPLPRFSPDADPLSNFDAISKSEMISKFGGYGPWLVECDKRIPEKVNFSEHITRTKLYLFL